MKKGIGMALALAAAACVWAGDVETTLTIEQVAPGTGQLYVGIFDSEEGLKKREPVAKMKLEAAGSTVSANVALAPGDYYITVYQDINGNGKMDANLIGMPKEPVGIANYSGKGIPGGYEKHKLRIDESNTRVTIVLSRLYDQRGAGALILKPISKPELSGAA